MDETWVIKNDTSIVGAGDEAYARGMAKHYNTIYQTNEYRAEKWREQ